MITAIFIGGPWDGETRALREPVPLIELRRGPAPFWLDRDLRTVPDTDTYRRTNLGDPARYEWDPWIITPGS